MRDVLARLLLALLVLVSSAGASPVAALTPSAGPGGEGAVRAGDEITVAPFEAAPAGVRIDAPRVVITPLPRPVTSVRVRELKSVAPCDLRARALRRMPHRRIHRANAPRAPDEF